MKCIRVYIYACKDYSVFSHSFSINKRKKVFPYEKRIITVLIVNIKI